MFMCVGEAYSKRAGCTPGRAGGPHRRQSVSAVGRAAVKGDTLFPLKLSDELGERVRHSPGLSPKTDKSRLFLKELKRRLERRDGSQWHCSRWPGPATCVSAHWRALVVWACSRCNIGMVLTPPTTHSTPQAYPPAVEYQSSPGRPLPTLNTDCPLLKLTLTPHSDSTLPKKCRCIAQTD
ncbi:hypothetical protein AAFF_G00219120 [Aldrovandia affinis]|uniref:Uncharacterized protein n=1 Tax=Aldrovandia affinis TaxID=143900 RepID=A0AAD7SWC0_9TELE|nr:hypothetical protein AAFF_G00219120 [Aldrovandia affinis]